MKQNEPLPDNSIYLDDEAIIRHILRGKQTAESIVALREATLPMIAKLRKQKKKICIFIDISRIKSTDSATRSESKKILDVDYDFMAIVGNRYLQSIVTYVLRAAGIGDKVRYFGKEAAALSWLRNPIVRSKESNFSRRLRSVSTSGWIILVVVALMSVLTALLWRQAQDRLEGEVERMFDAEVQKATSALEERLQVYTDALIGFQALYHASDTVNQKEFNDYFTTLDLEKRYPGFGNISYVARVPHAQRDSFLASVRQDTSLSPRGNPSFTISPAGDRDEYYVITQLANVDGPGAFGADLLMNEARRDAFVTSRDTGQARATATTKLLDKQGSPTGADGFLISLPVYKDRFPTTEQARRADIEGVVYVVLAYDDFFKDTFASVADTVHVRVVDETRATLHERSVTSGVEALSAEVAVNVAGRDWRLHIGAPKLFGVNRTQSGLPRTILTSGTMITVLLLAIFWMQLRAKRRAIKLADTMTEDLQNERNQAEAIKNKDEAILSSIGDGVFALDENGKVSLFNKTAEQLSGYKADEVLGKPYGQVLHFRNKHNDEVHNFIDEAQAGHQAAMAHGTLLVRKDGSLLAVADSAAPIFDAKNKQRGIIVVFRDVTEHERFERALRESNERFELAAKATSDVVYDLDIQTGELRWNDAFTEVYGYPPSEEANTLEWWTAHIHPEDVVKLTQAIDKLNDNKTNNWMAEYRFKKADGSYVFVRDRAFALRDPKGNAVRLIGSMLDVTEQKQLEQAKDEFISIVSHQLRTPLTAIRLFVEMLLGQQVGKLNEKQFDYAQKINISTARMIRLVGDILNVSRVELGRVKVNPEPTDINTFIKSYIDEVTPLAMPKKVKINFKPVPRLGKVNIDPTIFGQVVHNLLTNAIRYTKEGKGKVTVGFTKEKDGYVLSVTDNGIGIPPDAKAHIFQRFYRAENAIAVEGEGTGLGLYLIKIIADTAGGTAWFESEVGKGTTFYVKLPLSGMKAKAGERSLS